MVHKMSEADRYKGLYLQERVDHAKTQLELHAMTVVKRIYPYAKDEAKIGISFHTGEVFESTDRSGGQ